MPDHKSEKPLIIPSENGPYIVQNLSSLTGPDGKAVDAKPKMALCRCGKTSKRPFCDGTHTTVGFSDEKQPERVEDRRDNYEGKTITIHDNRGICAHAGFCTGHLKPVFASDTEPWIDPNGAAAEEIIKVIEMCPSGALSYTVDKVEHRDRDREPAISIVPNGPYRIVGGVAVEGVEFLEGTSTEHRTLCRCGESKNKPFCDGSHWHANFRDDNLWRVGYIGYLTEGKPTAAQVDGVDLVVIRKGDDATVLEGRCRHQGAMMADGYVEGDQLICGLHGWAYDCATGTLGDGGPGLHRFKTTIENGDVLISRDEIAEFMKQRAGGRESAEAPAAGAMAGAATNREEPYNDLIRDLATNGLSKTGSHGPVSAMGVPRYDLPTWNDIQFVTAQLHKVPQLDDTEVGTELVIGPRAKKPLRLEIPMFVSDMSFGALSMEAKVALSRGAELAGTGICSGEGGMLPEEQAANSRYFYELASARFGFSLEQLDRVQAFHFKGGQAAKTGTGGHLPGEKVTEKIAGVRGLKAGQDAISPARFPEWDKPADFRKFADKVRKRTGGIPIGFKLSAQHIEADIDAAIDVGVDYIILDGRGGGTGAAPLIFRDNISVPTIPALARARKRLDETGNSDVTLIITGGLRTPADFAKALALGADGIALGNAAIQAIGCLGTRACHTNNCPVGIATQKEHLRARLNVDDASKSLARFFDASVHLMAILARACGHTHLREFTPHDLTTFSRDMAYLTDVRYGGVLPL